MDIWGILGLMVFIFGTCGGTTTVPTTLAPCATGTYRNGGSCSACSVNCLNSRNCDKTNGHCTGGCALGYDANRDPKCNTVCSTGKYGASCGRTCSANCISSPTSCDKVTGHCTCKPGFQPPTCVAACTGRYGPNCSQECGMCSNGAQCDTVTGACSQCAIGYKLGTDKKCTQMCDGNTYGQDCRETCGKCAGGEKCLAVSGACPDACEGGYWGANCKGRCSPFCQNQQNCAKANGNCTCQPGYRPGLCNARCSAGRYGQDCLERCGYCLTLNFYYTPSNNCGHVNGFCARCHDNREMPLCKDCKSGYWGPRCLQQCGQCGGDGRCNPLTGVCTSTVCKDGWLLPSCTQKCNEGWYGQNCTKACGHCRDNSACRHDNGVCELECNDDYEGVLCQEEKQNLVGPVVGSVMAAAVIIAAAIIIVGVLRYVRRKKTSSADNGEFNTLADLHSLRRPNDTIRRSRDYQNVHDNPAANYDSVVRNHPDSHDYDSHCFPAATAASVDSQSDPVYQNADAQPPVASKPTVALKPPKVKKLRQMPENTYGNVKFGATTDGTYGNVN